MTNPTPVRARVSAASRCAALIGALLVSSWAQAQAVARSDAPGAAPPKVEVFVNSAMVLSNVGNAQVYRVDALQMLEWELSQGLPADEQAAQGLVQARLKALGAALQERTRHAAAGLALAHHYGVERMPAVVVDGQVIVYGITDVAQALRAYHERGLAPSAP